MGKECSTNGEKRNACALLVGKPADSIERPLEASCGHGNETFHKMLESS
jgi:hypothetical protein